MSRYLLVKLPFVFTERFYILLLGGFIPAFLFENMRSSFVIVVLYDGIIIMLALLDLLFGQNRSDIGVKRRNDSKLSLGIENEIIIEVENRSSRAIKLLVRDEPPAGFEVKGMGWGVKLSSHQTERLSYRVVPKRRGDYSFGDIYFRVTGRIGLVRKQIRVPSVCSARVYPNIKDFRKYDIYSQRRRPMEFGLKPIRFIGEGREFESLRDYVIGDDYQRINWKATARKGKPIIQQYQIERSQNIILMVNAGRMMTAKVGDLTKLDYSINATLMMAYAAIRMGDSVGIVVFSDEVISFLPPRKGRGQMQRLMDLLYGLEPRLIEPSYHKAFAFLRTRIKKRSLVVVFTDLIDERASSSLFRGITAVISRHLPLCIVLSDSGVHNLVEESPSDEKGVYQRAFAIELLKERQKALARLASHGVLILDVIPEKLTAAAVNKYLEVKGRGLI